MRAVVQALADHPNTDAVVLAGVYEREYGGKSLEELKRLARIFEDFRRWAFAWLVPNDCKRCEQERKDMLKRAIETLPSDPYRTRVELEAFVAELKIIVKRGAEKCKECRGTFLTKVLQPILSLLDHAELAKVARREYPKLMQPLTKPCFLRSKISIAPPIDAELVDAYTVEGGEVRIYRLPNELQYLYFLFPFEYRLSQKQVLLLSNVLEALLKRNVEFGHIQAKEHLAYLTARLMAELAIEENNEITREEVETLAPSLAKFTAGLGLLETLLADTRVQDIYIDAPIGKAPVHIYHQSYEECLTNIYLTPDDAESFASRFRAISGRPFSEADPVLDLSIHGVRIAAIGRPLSPEGMALALRRHKPTPWTLPQLVRAKFLSPSAAGLLSLLVDAQASLLVTGSRGSGKTSLLGALLFELLPKLRILVLEDTSELPVDRLSELGFKVQSLRVQPAVAGSKVELTTEDALRAALRLGESVLVVGEVRGAEAKTLFEAMRVGAVGNSVMGTIHGGSARDVFERVVHDLGIPPSSFKATDAIVVAAPIRSHGGVSRARRVLQITEVRKWWKNDPIGEHGFEDIMRYDSSRDELRPTRVLLEQKSQVMESIAHKWGAKPSDVMQNFELRAKIHKTMVEVAEELNKPELLEAKTVVRSNLVFHALFEEQLRHKRVDHDKIFESWRSWLNSQGRKI